MATDPTGSEPTPPPPAASTPPPMSGGAHASLVDRAKNLILSPAAEWARIDAEPATVKGLFTSYVMLLAAIPAIGMALGLLLFMPRIAGFYLFSTSSLLIGVVVQYLLMVASVYIVGLIIDALAPTFGSVKNPIQAMKVAAYYPTPFWVASILLIIPGLGWLAVLVGGLYSLYLLFLGLPLLMKTPQDKAVPYFAVTLLAAVVVLGVVNAIANRVIYGGLLY